MNEIKMQYEALKALAKEMMKSGNISEYFRLLNELNTLQLKPAMVKAK